MMDISQIARMIEWLDEERRKDKAALAIMEQKINQHAETISVLQKRLSSVESENSVLREQSLPAQREHELMEKARAEMRQMLEVNEARRLNAEREAERRAELNREGIIRSIRELNEQMDKLQRSLGSLTELRAEGGRIADMLASMQQRIDDLSKRFDEPDRKIMLLEEQRRQDSRRIAELESELPEVKKVIETMRPKLVLIEEISVRNERKIQDIQNAERERREQIQQFIDQQNLILRDFEQRIESLTKRFGEQDSKLQETFERFEVWSQTHRKMERIVEDFERISERLNRRINEVAEIQRLSEERFRQEWNGWREEEQKRWKQMTLSGDEAWRNHDREFDLFMRRYAEVEAAIGPITDSLKRLWNMERARAKLYTDSYQDLLREYDTAGASGLGSLSRYPNGIE
ncbi:MAG: hypothetical protein NZ750_01455 [Anaerolineae bacterium]|nr:hypothetical protein [Anaerolineae bacterium]MDW8173251.1 hypothetical protein [Anaerolineae bacterium]